MYSRQSISRRLRTGINWPMLSRVFGWLLLIEGGFMLIPLIAAWCYNEQDTVEAFIITIIVTVGSGLLLNSIVRPRSGDLGKRESFLLTVSVWIVFSLFGMLPYLLTPDPLTISNAFIEAMSGFTTTGLSTVPVGTLSHGQMMWGCVMQWVGGLGIIIFTLAVLPMLNHSGGMQMFNAETTGITHDKLRPRVSETAKGLWLIYIALTVLLVGIIKLDSVDMYDALCITFSVVSTGGGYPLANDLIAGSVYLKIFITLFMFLGGVNFHLLFKMANGHLTAPFKSEVFMTYVKTIVAMSVIFILYIWMTGRWNSFSALTIDPIFQIVSALSSTGFSASEFRNWGPLLFTLVMCMMFVGASAGSTSGGAKIDRIIYLIKNCRNEVSRTLHPNTIRSVKLNGKIVPPELVGKVMVFLAIYVMVIGVGGVCLTAMGICPEDAFCTAFMCISNCGCDNTAIGYGVSFDTLPAIGKWIMAFVMLIGRLELFTVLVLFTSRFWRQ